MAPRRLVVVLAAWAVATAVACVLVHRAFRLEVDPEHPRAVIASVWQGGQLVARAVLSSAGARDAAVDAAASREGATLVHEAIVGEGPVLSWPEAALSLSFVPGRDGLAASLGGRTAYVTPDELLAMQAYDRGITVPSWQLAVGLDMPLPLARAADALGVSVRDLVDHGRLRRIRVARTLPGAPAPRAITAETLSDADVRDGAVAMGRYLARGVDPDGRFRYLVNAPTNQALPGYDWPRHAGATYFLAQIAGLTGDAEVRFATLRAAAFLRDHALLRCGEHRCVGDPDEPVADLGSSALTVLAFVEIARTQLDEGYALLVPELTGFLRAQQRPDGELMHFYQRPEGRPLDVQLLYYSGEAAFALARAHALGGDPRDLDAATRALAHLVGPGWRFFGSRYYWGEEHWTCQAMDELWGRAPQAVLEPALDFCLGWQAYGRKLMLGPGDTPFDADGAYGVGPLPTPHLTPVGSRSEAGLATLDAARRAGRSPAELATLELQMRRSLAMLLRHQLLRGGAGDRSYLLADPAAVDGAMPGSEVDWQLRIDFAQHTGSALLRWLQREGGGTKSSLRAHPPNEGQQKVGTAGSGG
jgi:hypothetical protein